MGKKFKFKTLKNKKINLFEDNSDLNLNYISGPKIEIISNNEILIDGCNKILDYSNDYIKLSLDKISVILFGKNLYVINFQDKQIKIKGLICSLEFCK